MRKGAFSVHALHQALRILDFDWCVSHHHDLRRPWTTDKVSVDAKVSRCYWSNQAMTWQVTILDWIWCHSQAIMSWSILALEINATEISLLQTLMATWDLLVGRIWMCFCTAGCGLKRLVKINLKKYIFG
jgi:hypothetical protein